MVTDNVDMKATVENILNSTGYSDQRAAKMSVDDLLKLAPPCEFSSVSYLSQQIIVCLSRRRHSFCVNHIRHGINITTGWCIILLVICGNEEQTMFCGVRAKRPLVYESAITIVVSQVEWSVRMH